MMRVTVLVWIGLCIVACGLAHIHGGADVVFVVDGSDRVGAANFEKVRGWIKSVIQNWAIGLDMFRVAVISYGDGVHVESYLKDSVDSQAVLKSINSIRYFGSPADATEAIRRASSEAFLPSNGGRAGERQVIIHVGAGAGSDPVRYADQVKIATEKGIVVYNVAIGNGWIQNDLFKYASQPRERYSLPVANYDLLNAELTYILASRVENEVPLSDNGLPLIADSCLSRADIVICLDGSTSVTAPNFLIAKENIKSLVSHLPLSQDGVHVAAVQFSGKTLLEFPLNRYYDRLSLLQAIDRINYMHGNTETGQALDYIRTNVFGPLMGARVDVPRVVILLTDGQASHHNAAVDAGALLRQAGIAIVSVGIGSRIDATELEQISGDPSYVFKASDFQGLTYLIEPILNTTCQVQTMTPSPTSPTTPGIETCVDNITTCNLYIEQNTENGGFCAHYVEMAKTSCARSCGYCTTVIPTIPITPPTCVNKLDNCTLYATTDCDAFAAFFSERCQLMCGLCDVRAETPGFHGQCMYKSKAYGQGERWSDGCDYDCVCTDAAHGKFECTSKCDVYHDLPPFCTLVYKAGECCLQPVCHFESTANTFTVIAQGISPDQQNVCEYNGRQYKQDQPIDNGCSSQCICVDADNGIINCTDTCPVYNMTNFPSFCYLEATPGSCCKTPRCELRTSTAAITGFGTVSEHAGFKEIYDESKQPPCIDLKPECPLYGKDTCEGNYRPFMTENCPVFCDLCHVKYPGFVPAPDDRCMYNGVQYVQGDVWEPDCEHVCTCDTQYYGYYRCFSKCPKYNEIPSGCKLEKLASDCCPHVVCQVGTVLLPSTLNYWLPVAGTNIYINNIPLMPIVRPDGSVNALSTSYSTVLVNGCLFNGRLLAQGEIAKDGSCGATCQCVDDTSGLMSCVDRCATYAPDNDLCTVVTDPFDACCKVPSCPLSVKDPPTAQYSKPRLVYSIVKSPEIHDIIATYSTTTTPKAQLTTAPTTASRLTTYDPSHSHKPQSAKDLPTMPPGTVPDPNAPGTCDHPQTGQSYKEGERWTVGCDFNCICINSTRGQYICSDMCKELFCPIGYNCTSFPDPEFPCCDLLQINLPTPDPSATASTPFPTSLSFGQTCNYNGKDYHQGDTWIEGCERKCQCLALNDTFMSISCHDLCPKYISLPPGCQEVQVPGECCPVLQGDTCSGQYCLDPQGNPHLPGESWREGCTYECTCTQRPDGFYRECRGICPVFQDLENYNCTQPTPTPGKCCALPECCIDEGCTAHVKFEIPDQYKDEF
ncbi:uncharacterized protein LOC131929464 [Physella acuta]|uniref:uncharacterized protein LOC131929464 n=1 Tax=Physella acuta TaxID=109671 RepID=UPI0027DD5034|nr:uncharacterized protein LOC131929464 [Physella acuta]